MNTQPERSASRTSASSKPPGSAASLRGRSLRATKLLRHGDFQRVYQQGRRQFAPHMTLFYLDRAAAPLFGSPTASPTAGASRGPRVGLTVGRVLGGAVERNRIKRRMREAVRAHLGTLAAPLDVVINPKKSVLTLEFSELREEVGRALAAVQNKAVASREPRAESRQPSARDSGIRTDSTRKRR